MRPVRIFVLVPADTPHGPVKGAYALANQLVESHAVTLVALRPGPGADARLAPGVQRSCLAADDRPLSLRASIDAYRRLLAAAGPRDRVCSVSMCFSADWVNGFCRDVAQTCASVRGNLFMNYRLDYGWPGLGLAAVHLLSLRRTDHVVAMTRQMAHQLRPWVGRRPDIVGNFVDEPPLDARRAAARPPGPPRIVFVGSLSTRKRPDLLLEAVAELARRGLKVELDLLGAGPLQESLQHRIGQLGLDNIVRIHGFVADPLDLIARADLFVLPSLSEGVSRAALEALHLGVPVVLRDADGNDELVQQGVNGRLFAHVEQLPTAMAEELARPRIWPRPSLVPPAMRQREAARQLMDILKGPWPTTTTTTTTRT